MRKLFAVILGAVVLLSSSQRAFTADITNEIGALVVKVRTDIEAGKKTEADLADDLKQFDVLLAEHKSEKTDEVAQVLIMKAMLYLEVIGNPEKGKALLAQVKTDFPDSKWVPEVSKALAMMDRQAEGDNIRSALKVGAKFPDFSETNVVGKPLSISGYKGKVVLIDFWATWCVPCLVDLPNVLKTYNAYHDKGFEVIGVSLDEDQPTLERFIKDNNLAWPQYYDGKRWDNKLAMKYGVERIPFNYLLDGNGEIIGVNLHGDDLETAVAKAVAKK